MNYYELMKKDKRFMSLVINSIAIFPALFLGPKVLGVVLLSYVIVVALCLFNLLGIDIFSKLSQYTWDRGQEALTEKKTAVAGFHFIIFPMVVVGIIMVFLMIFQLLFLV